jgi:hypothetical protein
VHLVFENDLLAIVRDMATLKSGIGCLLHMVFDDHLNKVIVVILWNSDLTVDQKYSSQSGLQIVLRTYHLVARKKRHKVPYMQFSYSSLFSKYFLQHFIFLIDCSLCSLKIKGHIKNQNDFFSCLWLRCGVFGAFHDCNSFRRE